MASAAEVGIGIASVLATEHCPNPLPLSFNGQTPSEAASIILACLRECRDAGVRIGRLEVEPVLFEAIEMGVDVPLRSNPALCGQALFYRK